MINMHLEIYKLKLKFITVKKIFLFILFLSFVISKSFACEILNVPIIFYCVSFKKLDFLTLYKENLMKEVR